MFRSITKWQLVVVGWIFLVLPGLVLAQNVANNINSKTGRDLFNPVHKKAITVPQSDLSTSSTKINWPLQSPQLDQVATETQDELLNLASPSLALLADDNQTITTNLREYLSLLVALVIIVLIMVWWWLQGKVCKKIVRKNPKKTAVLDLKNQVYERKNKRS